MNRNFCHFIWKKNYEKIMLEFQNLKLCYFFKWSDNSHLYVHFFKHGRHNNKSRQFSLKRRKRPKTELDSLSNSNWRRRHRLRIEEEKRRRRWNPTSATTKMRKGIEGISPLEAKVVNCSLSYREFTSGKLLCLTFYSKFPKYLALCNRSAEAWSTLFVRFICYKPHQISISNRFFHANS